MTDQTPTGAAVEQRQQGPGALVKQYEKDIALVLPSHVKPEQFVRIAQGVLRRDKNLAQIAQRNIGSFMTAVLDCARLGLEPGDTYHFVAYGNAITGIRDYKGEIELIYRAGAVASVKAEVVHANDLFEYEPGTMERPRHEVDWFGDRGEMVGVYAYAVMKDGSTSKVVVMSKAEVDRARKVSRSSSGASSPWVKWPDRMWIKTAVHQLYKWVPKSPEFRMEQDRGRAALELVDPSLSTPPADYSEGPDIPEAVDPDDEVVDAELVDEPA